MKSILSILPTIGKVVGSLLTQICDENGVAQESYLEYDISPDGPSDQNYRAVFTNQGGKIILSHHAINATKKIRLGFPASSLAECDDITIGGNNQADVSELFAQHSQMDDGSFDLAAMPVEENELEAMGTSMENHIIKNNIPTDGTAIPFGALTKVAVKGNQITFTLNNSKANIIRYIPRLNVTPVGEGENISANIMEIDKPSGSYTVQLPYSLDPSRVSTVDIDATLNLTGTGNDIRLLRQSSEERTVPISEQTLRIFQHGVRVNG